MSPTLTVELELPAHALSDQRTSLQRSMIRHLLHEERITMPEALALLGPADQAWLVETTIQDAQEALLLASQLTEPAWRERYWQQYNKRLGYLLHWHEHWSTYHTEIVTVLRTVLRRYAVRDLTPKRAKVLHMLTDRLHADRLYREDVFAAEQALQDVGWNVVVDLAPIADQLLPSYLQELGRA